MDVARRFWPDVIWIYDRAEEMSDDLHCFPEKMREKSSLRTRIVDGPGNAASGARQANIALRADSMA